MANKFDARQTISRDVLSRITGTSGSQLDQIIRDLNAEITPPLPMSVTGSNLVVTIGNIVQANPNTLLNRTIPPISNLLPTFTSGTVTVGATGAGSATPSVGSAISLGMTLSQFLKIGINIDANGSLTLTKGTPASSLAAATVPPTVSGLFGIGYFVVQTDSSNNCVNFTTASLYQYVGGGGSGSGTGNGNTTLETLKNEMVDSPYQLVTPNVITTDGVTKINTLTGAAYDLVTNTIKFTANAQVLLSTQNLDSTEFLSQGLDVGSLDLSVFWNLGTTLQAFSVPTAFTYEVSRDGGTNWFTVAMSQVGSTNVFRGPLRFDTSTTTEATKQTILTQTTTTTTDTFNATTLQAISQAITIAATTKIQQVNLKLSTGSATPLGNFTVALVRDSAGTPSLLTSDIIAQTNLIAMSSLALTTTPTDFAITFPGTVVTAGTYHLVISIDGTYKAGFIANNNASFKLDGKITGAASPFANTYNGTSWTSTTNQDLYYVISGRALDLRLRITSAGSPTYPCGLDGYGIFYNLQDVGIVGASRKTQRFAFNSVTDNLSSFTISAFNPDPDLLNCYWVEGGQVFKSPAFQLNGNVVAFPTNTFNNAGVSQTITLIFDQNHGGAFDNSDSNRRLAATNHLGSTNGTDDTSASGRGIILRNAAGTLMELALDTDGLPIILSVP